MRHWTVALTILAACTSATPSGDGGTPDSGGFPDAGDGGHARAIGTWSNVQYAATCPTAFGPPVGQTIGRAANANFRCATLTITCPDLADTTVSVALAAQPPGVATRGAIATHGGGGGTYFFGGKLPQAWFDDGFAIAQIAWPGDWECPQGASDAGCNLDTTPLATRAGVTAAACRPATVLSWIHEQAQLPDGTAFQIAGSPFCGFGASGGSGALWYSLLYYGLGEVLDYAVITASTPFGRIDIGCDPSYDGQTVAATCDNVASPPQVPQVYTAAGPGPMTLLDNWSSSTSCDNAPSSDDLAYWKRNSLVSAEARYDVPTPVTTYDCVDVVGGTVNLVPAMNTYLFEQLRNVDPSGLRFKAMCVVNGTNGTCSGEGVFGDPDMADAGSTDMEQNCKPLAR